MIFRGLSSTVFCELGRLRSKIQCFQVTSRCISIRHNNMPSKDADARESLIEWILLAFQRQKFSGEPRKSARTNCPLTENLTCTAPAPAQLISYISPSPARWEGYILDKTLFCFLQKTCFPQLVYTPPSALVTQRVRRQTHELLAVSSTGTGDKQQSPAMA